MFFVPPLRSTGHGIRVSGALASHLSIPETVQSDVDEYQRNKLSFYHHPTILSLLFFFFSSFSFFLSFNILSFSLSFYLHLSFFWISLSLVLFFCSLFFLFLPLLSLVLHLFLSFFFSFFLYFCLPLPFFNISSCLSFHTFLFLLAHQFHRNQHTPTQDPLKTTHS